MMKSIRSSFNRAIIIIYNPHFWAITFLTAIAATIYYYELLDLKWLPFDFSFLSYLSAYHVHYLLFLPPMLYAAGIFGVSGALVSSAVIFVIIVPRELLLPTWPIFTIMPVFWSIFTMAAILLGREKADRHRLRASEARYRDLFDSGSDAIIISDMEGKIIEANQAMAKLTGYRREELPGMNIREIFCPDDAKLLMEKQQDLLKDRDAVQRYESEMITRDGTRRTIESIPRLITQNGQAKGIQTILRDVTDRKRMESALRDSEEFSSSLLYNSPYPVVVVNPDSSIRYVNPALEKLTGFTAAELIGKKLPYPWWPEETLEKTSQDLQKGMSNETTRVEQLFRTKNGERFWVEITSIAVKREGEFKYYVAAWVDITERKRLKENMQFYISEIIMAQEEERKRIARELHDDTAQSLAVLSLNIDVILEHKFELPDDTTRRLVELRQGTIDTLDNLRRFSRELRPDILDQAGLVSALELLTQDLMNVGGIDSYLELRGEERRLSADAELLMFRIAQEAMHNIRKHSQATEARVVIEFTRETARLTVNDNGKGFEVPDELGDLASRGRLGLVGMRERARLLNANFSVRSEVGKGTTLMVELAI